MHKLITSLLLLGLSVSTTESIQVQSSRRNFFAKATSALATAAVGGEAANAGIDVSGIKVEQPPKPPVTPGRPPNAPKSGPLAGTALGFQVGGGPRSEEVRRRVGSGTERY